MNAKKAKDTTYTSFEDYKNAMKVKHAPKKTNKHYLLGLQSAQVGVEKNKGSIYK